MRLSVVVWWLAVPVVSVLTACSQPPPPVADATTTSTGSTTSARPSTTEASSDPPSATSGAAEASGTGIPADLVPNVVEDECLLTPPQFGSLLGRVVATADNTELADAGGRRSCFYGDARGESVGRIDVYAPAAASARDLVARIAANSAGSHPIVGVGDGCVVVPGREGSFELVVASRALLVVLTLPPGAAAAPPADTAWSSAATAMLARLPS